MASLWQKSMMYLGLVDEETLEDVAPSEPRHATQSRRVERSDPELDTGLSSGVRGRRVEPPSNTARRGVEDPAGGGSGAASGAVRPVPSSDAQCEIITVTGFDHAKLLADKIRERTAVLLNLRDTDPEMVRRLVDFATGLTYALDGSMRKVSDGVVLVLPPRVSLGREEKRRLADLGMFDLDDNVR